MTMSGVLWITGLSGAGKTTLAKRVVRALRARTCAFLAGEGCFVVCSTMSMFQEIWTHNRQAFDPYLEVLLAVPVEVLKKRDTKGIYRAGVRNVAGVDLEVTWPQTPDLVLSSEGEGDLARNAALLVGRARDMRCGFTSRRTA